VNPSLIQALEDAISKGVRDGLSFPIIAILVSPARAEVWAIEVNEGPDGMEHREVCGSVPAGEIHLPVILYLNDRRGKTFQADIQPGTVAQA
jgi:hypothetical protein